MAGSPALCPFGGFRSELHPGGPFSTRRFRLAARPRVIFADAPKGGCRVFRSPAGISQKIPACRAAGGDFFLALGSHGKTGCSAPDAPVRSPGGDQIRDGASLRSSDRRMPVRLGRVDGGHACPRHEVASIFCLCREPQGRRVLPGRGPGRFGQCRRRRARLSRVRPAAFEAMRRRSEGYGVFGDRLGQLELSDLPEGPPPSFALDRHRAAGFYGPPRCVGGGRNPKDASADREASERDPGLD